MNKEWYLEWYLPTVVRRLRSGGHGVLMGKMFPRIRKERMDGSNLLAGTISRTLPERGVGFSPPPRHGKSRAPAANLVALARWHARPAA